MLGCKFMGYVVGVPSVAFHLHLLAQLIFQLILLRVHSGLVLLSRYCEDVLVAVVHVPVARRVGDLSLRERVSCGFVFYSYFF